MLLNSLFHACIHHSDAGADCSVPRHTQTPCCDDAHDANANAERYGERDEGDVESYRQMNAMLVLHFRAQRGRNIQGSVPEGCKSWFWIWSPIRPRCNAALRGWILLPLIALLAVVVAALAMEYYP